MRLLVGGFLDFEFGRGLAHLALEFVAGLLELTQALSDAAREFRKLLRAEKQNENQGDENRFRPARHAKSNRESHNEETTRDKPSCKEKSQIKRTSDGGEEQLELCGLEGFDRGGVVDFDQRERVVVEPDHLAALDKIGGQGGIFCSHGKVVVDGQDGKAQVEFAADQFQVEREGRVTGEVKRALGVFHDEAPGFPP